MKTLRSLRPLRLCVTPFLPFLPFVLPFLCDALGALLLIAVFGVSVVLLFS